MPLKIGLAISNRCCACMQWTTRCTTMLVYTYFTFPGLTARPTMQCRTPRQRWRRVRDGGHVPACRRPVFCVCFAGSDSVFGWLCACAGERECQFPCTDWTRNVSCCDGEGDGRCLRAGAAA